MFKFLSNLINSDDNKPSEPQRDEMSDIEYLSQYDSTAEDYDNIWDKDYLEELRSYALQDVYEDIRYFIRRISLLHINPYPTRIYKDYQELSEQLVKFKTIPENIFDEAAGKVLNNFMDITGNDYDNSGDNISICKDLRSNRKSFNISPYLIPAYDVFFSTFRQYWENAIGELKRRHAIINRRKYLVGRIDAFLEILTLQGITKYIDELLDYRQFNLDQIDVLTNNNSKN